MKTITCVLSVVVAMALAPGAMAQAKKKPAEAGKPAAEAAKPAAAAAAPAAADAKAKPAKAYPFESVVDEIDPAGKSFVHNNVDGKKVKFVLAADAPVKKGEAEGKFEDIKVGDSVSGLRLKTNPDGTQYEITKITNYGVKEKKGKEEPKKEEPKKPEKKKV